LRRLNSYFSLNEMERSDDCGQNVAGAAGAIQ
jgi:hypothetical protein